jgi:DnaJ-class molecular chaperone
MSKKNQTNIKLNPYDILGVSKDADQSTITKSHRKLMLKWHPDKFRPVSTNSKEQEKELANAKEMYDKISKSHEILSDPDKRAKYDKYDIVDHNDEQEMAEEMAREMMMKERLKEVIRINVEITDVLNGIKKPLNVQRQIINTQNGSRSIENIVVQLEIDSTVPVNKPIVFEGKGKKLNNECGDLFVVLNIISDSTYKLNKSNNNIITTQKISLAQSLCGFEMSIPHNKKNLVIQNDNIIKQNHVYTIKQMGLTVSNENEQLVKTDIEVHFDIQYPSKLEENTVRDLKHAFKYNYNKAEFVTNKDIVTLCENKMDVDSDTETSSNIGLEQIFMGGIPGMGMGGIPGMGMGGMPFMGGVRGRHQQVHVQECNQS